MSVPLCAMERVAEAVNESITVACGEGYPSSTYRVASFFRHVRSVGQPALLRHLCNTSPAVREPIVIGFAGLDTAIFSCKLPLQFGDRVQLENDHGDRVQAKVIAARYDAGKTAVAVQIIGTPLLGMRRP